MSWGGGFFRPKDSKGRESRTLFFVGVTVGIIWLCMLAGLIVFIVPFFLNLPPRISFSEFASSEAVFSGILSATIGIWLSRDWMKDRFAWKQMELENKSLPGEQTHES